MFYLINSSKTRVGTQKKYRKDKTKKITNEFMWKKKYKGQTQLYISELYENSIGKWQRNEQK